MPDRLIPFVALREMAPARGISLPRFGAEQNNAYNLEGELRQAAVRGELRVEGRQYRGLVRNNDPLVSILASHFEEYGFAHGVLNYNEPNDRSHTGNTRMMTNMEKGIENVTFYDLHLSEKDAPRVIEQFKEQRP